LIAYQQEQGMTPTQLILRWKPIVAKASHRVGVPVAWINAVIRVESGGRTMLTDIWVEAADIIARRQKLMKMLDA
jgi:hypothetical protein